MTGDPLVCKSAKHFHRQTAAKYDAAYTNLACDSVVNVVGEGTIEPTYPRLARTEDGDVVFLESFVDSVPDQPGSNHRDARCRVVSYLGEPSGIDVDSLCRRKPGIRGMTTALHLRHQGVRRITVVRDCKHQWPGLRTAKGTFLAAITLS